MPQSTVPSVFVKRKRQHGQADQQRLCEALQQGRHRDARRASQKTTLALPTSTNVRYFCSLKYRFIYKYLYSNLSAFMKLSPSSVLHQVNQELKCLTKQTESRNLNCDPFSILNLSLYIHIKSYTYLLISFGSGCMCHKSENIL